MFCCDLWGKGYCRWECGRISRSFYSSSSNSSSGSSSSGCGGSGSSSSSSSGNSRGCSINAGSIGSSRNFSGK